MCVRVLHDYTNGQNQRFLKKNSITSKDPSEPLYLKKYQKTLILAFEAVMDRSTDFDFLGT